MFSSRLFSAALLVAAVAATLSVEAHKELHKVAHLVAHKEPHKEPHQEKPKEVVNPCDTFKCGYGGKCVVNAENRPECNCDFACKTQYTPVCGSDGETYSNQCELERASCLERRPIAAKAEGPCPLPAKPGQPSRPGPHLCPRYQCTQQYHPVCGTDGATYANSCVLNGATCLSYGKIKLLSEGPCPKHECPSFCMREYRPVCGSDGNTYSNACELRRLTCTSSKFVYVLREGVCAGK